MPTRHGKIVAGDVHIPYNWSYADAAAREGAGGFTSDDVGKLARQEDTDTLWLLTATTPTWEQLGRTQKTNAGNPNGVIDGIAGDHCYDTTNAIVYYCHTNGNSNWVVV